MSRTSLYVDIGHNPRTTEGSNVVAKKWGATVDPYLAEIPDVESGNEQCRELYFNITAERLLFRKKLLGLLVDEDLVADANIAAAHPFGEANPTFGELAVPSVRLAAAFVPLTPDEKDVTHRPVMARLYCASGLSGRYASPFTEGLQDAGIQNYNWFVAGVKDDVLKMGISGRSWLLAANLLMRIVEQNDMATARNLINNFIVTGNVEDGAISRVTIGRKPELVNIKEFRNFKWIMPMKNANEMTTVPVRRIEPPETLQEAYELIESMQNKATRSFFRFLKKNDLVGMKEQYDMGADIFANDAETGLSSSEYLEGVIKEKREELGGVPKVFQGHIMYRPDDDTTRNWNKRIELTRELISLDATRCWLRAMGSNCSDCIYMLAKSGLRDALAEVLQTYPINAKDEHGLTATDMAIIGEDSEAVHLLVSFGGKCETMGTRNPKIRHILENIRNMTENMWSSLALALDAGLSLDARSSFIDCETDGKGSFWDTWKLRLPLQGRAIYEANERLLQLCMSHGMNLDKPFLVEYIDDGSDPESTPEDVANGKEYVVGSEMMKPLAFAYMIGNNDAVEMLKRHGAAETDDITAFVREQENEKKARWHKLFLQAIDKLCGTDDSPENHELIRKCLKHGESISEEIRGVRLAVETPDSPPCYVRAPLYGVAILHGWTNMLQDCLEIGFPANDEITFVLDVDYGGGVDVDVESKGFVENVCEGDVVASWTPMQIALRCNKAKKRDVVELLKKYGAK